MSASLPFLLQITIEAMKSDIDEVALQGIEFWSNVCDEEMDLAIEASEVCSYELLKKILFTLPSTYPFLLIIMSNFRRQSRGAPQSTLVSSMPRGPCNTWYLS